MKYNLIPIFLTLAYEGDEPPPADEAARKAAEEAAKSKKFTQEELNKILAEEKRKTKAASEKLVGELEAIKSKVQLTAQEKEELEQRIEAIKSESMTKEELAKQEREKLSKQAKQEREQLTAEAARWKTKFVDKTIEREIIDAAVAADAYKPNQLVAQLKSATRLEPKLDDNGKPTDDFVVKVKITVKDGDKDVTLDLPVAEAVKKMRDNDEFANLFKGQGTGGAGGTHRTGKIPTLAHLAKTDPAAYRKARAEGKTL